VELDRTFAALADPTRRAILEQLTLGEATPQELGAGLPISAPALSRHLKVLERAGLIARRVDAQRRPCRLRREGLSEAEDWLDRHRRALEASYARLDRLLAAQDEERER
jgi:DNA-binding transcriptional ArsR family regulator